MFPAVCDNSSHANLAFLWLRVLPLSSCVAAVCPASQPDLCVEVCMLSCCCPWCCTGAPVSYIITARNTGAVRLKNLSLLLPPWASVANCTPSGTVPGPWTIWPHRALVCRAEYNVTHDFYEAGPLSFVASAKPNELNTSVASAPAVITPTYTAGLSSQEGACSLPSAARKYRIFEQACWELLDVLYSRTAGPFLIFSSCTRPKQAR